EVAEAAKLLENTYRAVNIALVNETKVILDAMGIDVWRVIDAAATKPFGFQRFEPGPGFGGHCIPVDPFYLAHRASELGVAADFIALAGEVNVRMPKFVIEKLETALADRGTRLEDASVLLVGLAYKPNIDDDRESPAAELLALLSARGVHVAYHDPHIPLFAPMRKHRFELESTPLTKAALAEFDAAVIVTRHDAVDYSELGKRIPLIIDTRNAMAAIPECSATVVRA
ncbi:MAG: nucleotide sugar dehydrogenase, partial [Planctomycetota bacterium]